MLIHFVILALVFAPITFLALYGLEDCSGGTR